jgi:hypothetical protein
MGLRSIGQIPDAAYVASEGRDHRLDLGARVPVGSLQICVERCRSGFFATEMNGTGDDPEQFPEFLPSRLLGRGGRAGGSMTPSCSC